MTTTTKPSADEIRNQLAHASGSSQFFRVGFPLRNGVYTEGVQHMAELCQAYWLIDAIASHISTSKRVRAEPFQVWRLQLKKEGGARLAMFADDPDGERHAVVTQDIEYTDFPLDQIDVWVGDNGEGLDNLPAERALMHAKHERLVREAEAKVRGDYAPFILKLEKAALRLTKQRNNAETQRDELTDAARLVIARWEKGDLAAAVRGLEEALP